MKLFLKSFLTFFICSIFFLFYSPSYIFAANRYWVGASDGANTNDTANWSTAQNSCGVSGGASVPGSSDVAIFTSSCANDSTINSNLSVLGININSGYSGTIIQSTGITIAASTSGWTQAGGTFSGGNATIDINGNMSISGGSFTATSGTLTLQNSLTISGGSTAFNHNNGTFTFDGTSALNNGTLACNSVTFNSVVINKAATLTIGSDCTLPLGNSPTTQGGITNNGILNIGTGTWTHGILGNIIFNTGSRLSMTGTTIDTTDSITLNSGTVFDTPNLTTLNIERSLDNSGNVLPNGLAVLLDGASTLDDATVVCGNATYDSITINKVNQADTTFASDCTISGNFIRTSGIILNSSSAYTLDISGDFSMSTTHDFGGSNLTIGLTGGNIQAISQNAANTFASPLEINKSANSASLSTNLTTTSTCTIVEGTFDTNAKTFSCGSTFTVQDGGNLQLQGIETVSTPTLNSGSRVTYDGTSGPYTVSDWDYHHLTFNGNGGTFNLEANETVAGNFTITSGTVNSSSETLGVAGNWSNSGTFNHNNGLVNLNGTSQQITGSTSFYDFTKSTTSTNTLTFEAGSTQTIENGLTLNGQSSNLLSLRSSINGTQWRINPQGARDITYVDVEDSNNINATEILFNATNTYGDNLTNWGTASVTPSPTPDSDPAGQGNNEDDNDNDDDEIMESCEHPAPPELTWVKFKPVIYEGIPGTYITWTQYSATKMNIKIDDGTGAYPWMIKDILNDGHEFLPNVAKSQNIMIQAVNHCETNAYSAAFSGSLYPLGWFNK